MYIPDPIRKILGDRPHLVDTTGMSGSAVWLYEDMVMKAERVSAAAENEYRMLTWLHGRLPVPEVLAYTVEDGTQYMVMTRLEGQMVCVPEAMEKPELAAGVLAEGLRRMWTVDTDGCPGQAGAEALLKLAEKRVEAGEVDVNECDPATFGPGGFRDPAQLLAWLEDNRSPYDGEPVLVHGDFCLPNVFWKDGRLSGYLDLGHAGTGDRWQDIALCYRSLMSNARGEYGRPWPGYTEMSLFDALGLAPDWDRIRYYILLDELF